MKESNPQESPESKKRKLRQVQYKLYTCFFSKDYYIWGTGYYGEMCYELFHELGIKIAGFIDNHIQQELLHNFVVITLDKICEDNIICISTPNYESEIKEQLFRMHFAVERCICFSDIQSRIYEELNRDKS